MTFNRFLCTIQRVIATPLFCYLTLKSVFASEKCMGHISHHARQSREFCNNSLDRHVARFISLRSLLAMTNLRVWWNGSYPISHTSGSQRRPKTSFLVVAIAQFSSFWYKPNQTNSTNIHQFVSGPSRRRKLLRHTNQSPARDQQTASATAQKYKIDYPLDRRG